MIDCYSEFQNGPMVFEILLAERMPNRYREIIPGWIGDIAENSDEELQSKLVRRWGGIQCKELHQLRDFLLSLKPHSIAIEDLELHDPYDSEDLIREPPPGSTDGFQFMLQLSIGVEDWKIVIPYIEEIEDSRTEETRKLLEGFPLAREFFSYFSGLSIACYASLSHGFANLAEVDVITSDLDYLYPFSEKWERSLRIFNHGSGDFLVMNPEGLFGRYGHEGPGSTDGAIQQLPINSFADLLWMFLEFAKDPPKGRDSFFW